MGIIVEIIRIILLKKIKNLIKQEEKVQNN